MSRPRAHLGGPCRQPGCHGTLQISHGEVNGQLRALLICATCAQVARTGGRKPQPALA